MRASVLILVGLSALHAVMAQAAGPAVGAPASGQVVVRVGTQASVPGPEAFFTGQVRVDPIWNATDDLNAAGAHVTFEPGARSAWHTHPKGQRLLVVSGVGRTQQWGQPIQEIRPGDSVWCPPGVKHWHGAAPTTAMTHLTVSGTIDGKNVEWMEKVSDDQYTAR